MGNLHCLYDEFLLKHIDEPQALKRTHELLIKAINRCIDFEAQVKSGLFKVAKVCIVFMGFHIQFKPCLYTDLIPFYLKIFVLPLVDRSSNHYF